jgi:hypothetical protein
MYQYTRTRSSRGLKTSQPDTFIFPLPQQQNYFTSNIYNPHHHEPNSPIIMPILCSMAKALPPATTDSEAY